MNKIQIASLSVALAFACANAASAADSVPASLRACAKIAAADARLVCYDREISPYVAPAAVASPATPAASPDPGSAMPIPLPATAPAPAPAPAADASTGDADFGMTPQLASKTRPDEETPADEDNEMTAMVTEIRKTGNRALIVTLDNGQIWQQKYASSSFRLLEGDTVTIRKGNFGGYSMVGSRSRSKTQVRRVQ